MMFFRDYFRVLVPLFVAFTIYHATVVPLLEPSEVKNKGTQWPSVRATTRDNWWEEFFADGEWQRDKQNPPRVMKTESATLLFQTREQKSPTRWLVKPLTILIHQRDSGSKKRAVLIRNNEGAEIQFKTAVDWTQELPPIVSGQLLGEISIYSPPEDESKGDGMLINSRDLRINKRQIWTNQRVRCQLGKSLVEGSYLQIFMDKDLLAAETQGAQKNSPFNGLDRLELTYVERVHVGLEPGGLWPRKDISDIASRPAHATLTCRGSFEFQFHQSRAILSKGVHMEHLVQGLPVDMFDCNELRMDVGWQSKPNSNGASKVGSMPNSNWNVERIEAFGIAGKNNSDHAGWLKLNAPGMQAEAFGQYLEMDVVNGIVTLSNKLPGATSREMTPAYLRREAVQVWSPEVQYQNAAAIASSQDPAKASTPKGPSRLGALMAQGAGRAQMDSNGDSWKLSWGERLLVRPDPNDLSKDLVDVKGSANISSLTQGRFRAEQLYLWLIPTSPELAQELAASSPDGKSPQWLPDRVEADGKVDVDSPSLRATVEKMQIWFGYPTKALELPQPTQVPNAPALYAASTNALVSESAREKTSLPELKLLPSSGAMAVPLKQPISMRPGVRDSNGLLSANSNSPLVVTAKTMRAKVLRTGNDNKVEDLILEGNFALTKNQLADDSPWPFSVTGDALQMGQKEVGISDITVVGQPAKVAVGSGWVVATELRLKQKENQFWIDHPGELLMPVEALQRNQMHHPTNAALMNMPFQPNPLSLSMQNDRFLPSRAPSNDPQNNIRWHEAPRVQWGGRMTFDGRIARFGGGVVIHCRMETDPKTLWHIEARSNQMAVEMDKPVSMRSASDQEPSPPSQISMIRLEDSVDLQVVQTDMHMQRKSIEHMKVPQLDILVPTQLWMAHGPGDIISRRLGNEGAMSNLISTSSPTNRTDRASDTPKNCIHLSFAGRMEGDLGRRQATFFDRILALIGPIPTWDDSLNVHAIDRPGRNQSILNSDQLSIFDASSLSWNQSQNRNSTTANNPTWEIAAQGRVQLQSNTESGDVYGTGENLKYAAASDTVRIEGSPQRPAHISSSGFNGYLKSASYRLSTGEFQGQITKIEGDLPPSMQTGNGAPGPSNVQPAAVPGAKGNLQSPRDIPLRQSGRNG